MTTPAEPTEPVTGLPEGCYTEIYWCTENKKIMDYRGDNCCTPVEIMPSGTRDKMRRMELLLSDAAKNECLLKKVVGAPYDCGECFSCKSRALTTTEGGSDATR